MRRYTWKRGSKAAKRARLGDGYTPVALSAVLESEIPIVVMHSGSKAKGWAAFAKRLIGVHETIGEYTGVVRPLDSCRKDASFAFDLKCCGLCVDASEDGNLTRFINHALPPANNVAATVVAEAGVRKVVLSATREVLPGHELLLDYGFETPSDWV